MSSFFHSSMVIRIYHIQCLLGILDTSSLFSLLMLELFYPAHGLHVLTDHGELLIAVGSPAPSPRAVSHHPIPVLCYTTLYVSTSQSLIYITSYQVCISLYCIAALVIKLQWHHTKINKSKPYQPQIPDQLEKILSPLNQVNQNCTQVKQSSEEV